MSSSRSSSGSSFSEASSSGSASSLTVSEVASALSASVGLVAAAEADVFGWPVANMTRSGSTWNMSPGLRRYPG